MREFTQHIAVLYIDVHIPMSQSLKDKRMVLKSLKDKIRNKFNVSIAELDDQDKWQTATLAFAMIGNDNRYLDQCLQNILSEAQRHNGMEICNYQIEFI